MNKLPVSHTGFMVGNLKEIRSGRFSRSQKIILKRKLITECEDVAWLHLAQDRNLWRHLRNTVMSFWVSQNMRNYMS